MGVHNLWRLLELFSSPTLPQEWKGKRVAIDASIWMAQFRHASRKRPRQGDFHTTSNDSHDESRLEGFLSRILKLLFYGIIPVFVFDGPASTLKRDEAQRRRNEEGKRRRLQLIGKAKRIIAAQIAAGEVVPLEESVASAEDSNKSKALLQQRLIEAVRGNVHKLDDEFATAEASGSGAQSGAHRVRHAKLKKKRPHNVVLAPEVASRAQTSSFLAASAVVVNARRQHDLAQSSNLLSEASGGSALFLGPRSALQSNSGNVAQPSSTDFIDTHDPETDDSDVVELLRQRDDTLTVISSQSFPNESDDANSNSDSDECTDTTENSSDEWVSDDEVPYDVDASNDDDDCMTLTLTSSEMSTDDEEYAALFNRQSTVKTTAITELLVHDVDESSNSVVQCSPPPTSRRLLQPEGMPASSTPNIPLDRKVTSIPMDLLEIVELLRLCGVGYVISPSEADTQCAFLSREGLVDGVFTEDSDVVVHGARVVLRGFFSQGVVSKVEQADLEAAGLSKDVLVALAVLLGCDYCDGVKGIEGNITSCLQLIALCRDVPTTSELLGCLRGRTPPPDAVVTSSCLQTLSNITEVAQIFQQHGDLVQMSCADNLSILQRSLIQSLLAKWTSSPNKEKRKGAPVFVKPMFQQLQNANETGWIEGRKKVVMAFGADSVVVDRDRSPFETSTPDWNGLARFVSSCGVNNPFITSRIALTRKEMERRSVVAPESHKDIAAYLVRCNTNEGAKAQRAAIVDKAPSGLQEALCIIQSALPCQEANRHNHA